MKLRKKVQHSRVSVNKVDATIEKFSSADSAIHLVARYGLKEEDSDRLQVTPLHSQNSIHKFDKVINKTICRAKPKEDNYLHNNNMKIITYIIIIQLE